MSGGVNLIPQARIDAARRRSRLCAWSAGCAAYAVAAVAVWSVTRVVDEGADASLAQDMARIQEQTDRDRQAAAQLKPRLTQAMATLAASRSVGNQPDWSLLLALLAEGLGDEAVLSVVRLDQAAAPNSAAPQRSYTLHVEGLGRSHATVLEYVRQLEETGLFQSVTLIETRQESFLDGTAVAFSVDCALSDAQGEAR